MHIRYSLFSTVVIKQDENLSVNTILIVSLSWVFSDIILIEVFSGVTAHYQSMASNQTGAISNDANRSHILRNQDPTGVSHQDQTPQDQSTDSNGRLSRNNDMAVTSNSDQDAQQIVLHRGSSSGSNLLGATSSDNLGNQLAARPASATSVAIIDPIKRKHSLQSCNVLNDLRKQGLLCDVVLVVSDGSFPVHRAIMSACSPYFRFPLYGTINLIIISRLYKPWQLILMMIISLLTATSKYDKCL